MDGLARLDLNCWKQCGSRLKRALKQQLGLKLEPAKGPPIDYYVIDNVDKPSAN